ncbi:hypothetical protein [Aerosakkonema funiforme]|uniref:Uncharacterized protein n=2 Tax=Oscillatoriophycideae TaxID=1301283 RepID=A0A926VM52_9CYAN|nr:hypothetical protein [Aerosakkonema funiforme]MBD2186431.1 hypothetical protein [Aerosakkonema funiforme FACHB-1375]
MKVAEICRVREISVIDVCTPLVIPSFSSRGFPYVKDIYISLKKYLSKVSLVSAYDLYHEYLNMEEIYSSDVVFIDSGGYEAKLVVDLNDAYVDDRYAKDWTPDYHQMILNRWQPLSQLVFVSYDHETHQLISNQIESANSLFQKYPEVASDFLCKPESEGAKLVDVNSLIKNAHNLASFSILGITEKELGETLLERCQNLLRIRAALQEQGLQTPIHIFGCLEPLTVISYFLCGADIFDGLSWLRFAFVDGLATYHSTATLLQGEWSYTDNQLLWARWIRNLQSLESLSKAMSRFCKTQKMAFTQGCIKQTTR